MPRVRHPDVLVDPVHHDDKVSDDLLRVGAVTSPTSDQCVFVACRAQELDPAWRQP